MATSTTRRDVLAGAGSIATILATSAYALPRDENPDAALLALRAPYERTLAAMDLAGKPHSAAEDAYFALKTTRPDLDERDLRKASGLIPAEREWLRATDANLEVLQEITARPAHTFAGIVFKAKISESEGNADRDLMKSIVADLVSIGGAHA